MSQQTRRLPFKVHLGDDVYVTITNTIYLELDVLDALEQYLAALPKGLQE